MSNIFLPASVDDNHFILASWLGAGKIWQNAFNKDDDFGKLFYGLAYEFYRMQVVIKNFFNEMDIEQTSELITEWEESVGIPDDCFTNTASIEKRRLQIYQKFSNFGGVQTAEDFIRVASAFGVELQVFTGKSRASFPLKFPIIFVGDSKTVAHTIFFKIVTDLGGFDDFPLTFPLTFSEGSKTFLKCMFENLVPATVQIFMKGADFV